MVHAWKNKEKQDMLRKKKKNALTGIDCDIIDMAVEKHL